MKGESRWFRAPAIVLAGVSLFVVLLAEVSLGRSSGAPGELSLFLGRFHPLLVHLPIGVIVFVVAAELAALRPRLRARIDPVLGLALPALLVVSVAAFVLGHLLARDGGYPAETLSRHRTLELVAMLGLCVSVAVWQFQASHDAAWSRSAYRAVLGVTFLVLSAGAHFGANLTHGESYLTKYAPGPIRRLLGEEDGRSAGTSPSAPRRTSSTEPLVFGDVVASLLDEYCVECHGPDKTKGKLRLDSLEALMKGGESGAALVAGDAARSEIVRRIRLPVDDDERMPPEGKPGPTPAELAVIEFWIDRGATPALRVRDALPPAESRAVLESAVAKPVSGARSDPPKGSKEEAREPPGAPSPSPEPTGTVSAPPAPSPDEAPAPRTEPTAGTPAAETKPMVAAQPSGPAILADKCEKCHGASKRKGGLRVDSLAALVQGGEGGPAVVSGDPDRSELIRRVRLPLAAKEHMPPRKEPQLTDAEVSALVSWVRSLRGDGSRVAAARERASPDEPPGAPGEEASEPAAASESPSPPPSSPSPDSSPPEPALVARLPPRVALYEEVVAPLLSKRCGKCHTGEKPAARLRVDDYQALVEGGYSGPGIVPGKPDDSFIVKRISLPPDDDDAMPPEGEPGLSADEVLLVRYWVERGAPKSGEVPAGELPAPVARAAVEHVTPRKHDTAIVTASSGCAACALGRDPGAPRAAWLFGAVPACGLAWRRLGRRRQKPARRSA